MTHQYSLPEGYCLRPARWDDLPAAVELFNACSRLAYGTNSFDIEEIRRDWEAPGLNIEQDLRVVQAPDGSLAGYYQVLDLEQPHVNIHVWGRVHPAHCGLGIGSHLLQWAESRARLAVPNAPEHAQVIVSAAIFNKYPAGIQLLQNMGFQRARLSLRMLIDLDQPLPDPTWPAGITVRSMQPAELPAVVHAVRDSFKDHWGFIERPFEEELELWRHFVSSSPPVDLSLWFLAMDGDQIAGLSLCSDHLSDDPSMGWLGTLGVRRPWRRQGLGMALLHYTFQVLKGRACKQVGLGVDADSLTGATRLYTRAGMHPDDNRQLNFYEKVLRDGVDLRTQSSDA